MKDQKECLYFQLLKEVLEGRRLLNEYDASPHRYGDTVLFQAESHLIQEIGRTPDTTVTDLAEKLGKTPSACSQLVRKLRAKGLVVQTRNETNNRVYHLNLTDTGWLIYQHHEQYDEACRQRELQHLSDFSIEDLELFSRIQRCLNQAFEEDIKAGEPSN